MSLAMSRAVFEEKAKKSEETRRAVVDALRNEQITRERVRRLEELLSRGLWGRLNWLITGR